ncbi:MAG TPA: hypothetical protein VF013_01255 [Candidatus Limnocylindria bacterium]
MMEGFKVPKDPHPGEPDELTPDTLPIDDIERPHDSGGGPDDPPEPAAKDLDEPGAADRTPRP